MILYFVKHENHNKPFLFTGDDIFCTGDDVVCDTHKGEARGNVVLVLNISIDAAQTVAKTCGAYWPLAKVLRKYVKPAVTSVDDVPDHIKRQIVEEEQRRIINAIHPDVPFAL